MTTAASPTSSFDALDGPTDDLLLTGAANATVRATADPGYGALVVLVRPGTDHEQVISGGGSGVLRAAVSVAAAAGNDRAWRDAPDATTNVRPVRELPEVIAAAAEGDDVRAVHTGRVEIDGRTDVVAMWFETSQGVADQDERQRVLDELRVAAGAERERRIAAGETEAVTDADADGPAERSFDPNDPDLDPITGLYTEAWFDDHLLAFDGEEAMLVVIDIDRFVDVATGFGAEAAYRVLRITSDRLVANCRKRDVLARIGTDRFAILFDDMDRTHVMEVAKRLLADIAEPLPSDVGPSSITATVAFAHQVGLVDPEELLESAVEAIGSGKRAGANRVVVAA